MKYLKYLFGLLAILALVFFLLGFIKPKLNYDCEITVDKSVAESWAVLQDESKMGEWLAGFQKYEHLSGTPGTVGAISKVYFDNNGENMTIQETITDIKPNESISMTFVDELMTMDYKISLTPMEGKTKITSSTAAEGNSAISKSIMALIGGTIKGQEDTNLASLKKAIEQNTKNYFPIVKDTIVATEEIKK